MGMPPYSNNLSCLTSNYLRMRQVNQKHVLFRAAFTSAIQYRIALRDDSGLGGRGQSGCWDRLAVCEILLTMCVVCDYDSK